MAQKKSSKPKKAALPRKLTMEDGSIIIDEQK
jgi:hypothetical protein